MFYKLFQILCLLLALAGKGFSQDVHFSQQYATRLHLNPAYAGLHADYSGIFSYRTQWPGLDGSFTTNQFAGYYRLKNDHTTAGLVISRDQAGAAGISNLVLGGIYAYQTNLNENIRFSGGLQLSVASRQVDYDELIFGDQLNEDGTVNPATAENSRYDPAFYFSAASGIVLYNNNFWVSLSGYHLNRPEIGFNFTSRLPAKGTLNGGYKFILYQYSYLNKPYEWSVSPSLTYTRQGSFQKIDLALYNTYTPFTLGILYRSLPFLSDYPHDQALAVLGGVVLDPLKIGYAYEVPLSAFGRQSGGAHEISLSFEKIDYNKIFKKRVSGKNYKRFPCPSI